MNKAIAFIFYFGKPFRLALTQVDEDGYRICSLGSVCCVDTDYLRMVSVSIGDIFYIYIYIYVDVDGYLGHSMGFRVDSQDQ